MNTKKQSLLFTLMLVMVFLTSAKTRSTEDYFLGKWTVKIVGTPLGDFTRNYQFDKKEGTVSGIVQDTTGKELSKMTQVAVNDKTITGAYTHEGYDVTFDLKEVDADHVKGTLLGSYEVTGVRVKKQ